MTCTREQGGEAGELYEKQECLACTWWHGRSLSSLLQTWGVAGFTRHEHEQIKTNVYPSHKYIYTKYARKICLILVKHLGSYRRNLEFSSTTNCSEGNLKSSVIWYPGYVRSLCKMVQALPSPPPFTTHLCYFVSKIHIKKRLRKAHISIMLIMKYPT